jgi:membrane-associated phospholipid phosphatase
MELETPQQPQGTMTDAVTPAGQARHIWRYVAIGILVLVALAAGIGAYIMLQPTQNQSKIRPFFSYEEADLTALRAQSSTVAMSVGEVQKWEDKAYELVESHGSTDIDASKVYAYLTVAQMDAAALSFKVHGAFAGSLEPVSKDVLCEFYPDSCSSLITTENDNYSKVLGGTVLSRVKARMAEDAALTKPVTLKTGSQYWQGPAPQVGLNAPSFKPWFITKADQFRVVPPPEPTSAAIKQELVTVKQMLANATNEQKAVVVKWAGGPGTRTPPGIWLTLAADYMQAKGTSLDSYLETRALMSMAMSDAVIAVFDSKYYYQYKRPNMFDPSIITIMPTPNHPSYPAGHATISWAAATVLSSYLPDNKTEWERQAKEASDSRTIGGIHFPSDNTAGTTLGTNVGGQALKQWQE